eukprot:6192640-Pleurochrysis_carterae.AAC.1
MRNWRGRVHVLVKCPEMHAHLLRKTRRARTEVRAGVLGRQRRYVRNTCMLARAQSRVPSPQHENKHF